MRLGDPDSCILIQDMTSITFVRHGNTDWNNERRAQGQQHNPLSETGIRQAEAVAERLRQEQWDLLISSDLLRARTTAEAISALTGMPIHLFDERLREIGRGRLEGTIEPERVIRWGPDWRKLDLGEESYTALRARALDFVADMVRTYPGQRLLVVSHALLIGEALKGMTGDESTGNQLDNTSVTTLLYENNGWRYTLYNCTEHLQVGESLPQQ